MKMGVISLNHSPLCNSPFVLAPKAISVLGSSDPPETIPINKNTPTLAPSSA
jgi:hypothetical protein